MDFSKMTDAELNAYLIKSFKSQEKIQDKRAKYDVVRYTSPKGSTNYFAFKHANSNWHVYQIFYAINGSDQYGLSNDYRNSIIEAMNEEHARDLFNVWAKHTFHSANVTIERVATISA